MKINQTVRIVSGGTSRNALLSHLLSEGFSGDEPESMLKLHGGRNWPPLKVLRNMEQGNLCI